MPFGSFLNPFSGDAISDPLDIFGVREGERRDNATAANSLLQGDVADEIRNSFQDFITNNEASIQQQLDSLNDNSIVTDALADNDKLAGRSLARRTSGNARFGLGMTEAQRKSIERLSSLNQSKTKTGNVNNARLAQRDRNENVALGLSQNASTIRGQGLDNLLSAVGLSSARTAQSNASSAAATAGNQQTGAALASLAVAAF